MSAVTQIRQLAAPLDDLLRALLPADATIAVAATGDGDLPPLTGARAVHPADAGHGITSFLAAAGMPEFAVIPATAYDRLYGPGARPDSIGPWRLVTRQRHCVRCGSASGGRTTSAGGWTGARRPAGPASAAAARPPARRGLWQRILGLFRRR